jgi:hypothetical protein
MIYTDLSYVFIWKQVATSEFDPPTNILTFTIESSGVLSPLYNLMMTLKLDSFDVYFQLYKDNMQDIKENELVLNKIE